MGRDTARGAKIRRLARGGEVRVLDLFSGCGGLSLGFRAAGARIIGGLESDPQAAESHGRNFFGAEPGDIHAAAHDVLETDPTHFVKTLDPDRPPRAAVDLIVAGPPCQAFARVGRAKLRSVARHRAAYLRDARAGLYQHLLDFVRALQPLAVLIENVPDILNYGGANVAEDIADQLERLGYESAYTLLNAARYGVPQTRERMFLIAYARELGTTVAFPKPTHDLVMPSGYGDVHRVVLGKNGPGPGRFIAPPTSTRSLPQAVTAEQALGDLIPIHAHLEELATGRPRRGPRRFTSPLPYAARRPSDYAMRMRTWPGFEAPGEGVRDHVIRSLPRDYPIFRRMEPGDQYPEAHSVALRLLEQAARRTGAGTRTRRYEELRASIVPPYDPGKFPNKWRKLEPDRPSRTLMAHLGKDSYSHIHYDSGQARTISVREAARLQSFPDGFVFAGAMNSAFRQIGNAVPPLMALALARQVTKSLRRTRQ